MKPLGFIYVVTCLVNGKIYVGKGTKMSEESRRKMSEAAKKRLSDPTNNNMYGKHHSEEAKNKNRLSHLGRKHTEEAKRKMSIARKGKKHWWSTRKAA